MCKIQENVLFLAFSRRLLVDRNDQVTIVTWSCIHQIDDVIMIDSINSRCCCCCCLFVVCCFCFLSVFVFLVFCLFVCLFCFVFCLYKQTFRHFEWQIHEMSVLKLSCFGHFSLNFTIKTLQTSSKYMCCTEKANTTLGIVHKQNVIIVDNFWMMGCWREIMQNGMVVSKMTSNNTPCSLNGAEKFDTFGGLIGNYVLMPTFQKISTIILFALKLTRYAKN